MFGCGWVGVCVFLSVHDKLLIACGRRAFLVSGLMFFRDHSQISVQCFRFKDSERAFLLVAVFTSGAEHGHGDKVLTTMTAVLDQLHSATQEPLVVSASTD